MAVEDSVSATDGGGTLEQAMGLHQRGQLAEAEMLYREILAKDPKHFDALHLLGVVHAQRSDHLQATRLIGHAVAIDATSPIAFNNLGRSLKAMQRWEEALSAFDKALALQDDHVAALANRAQVLKELGRFEAALAAYEATLARKPDLVQAYVELGDVLQALNRASDSLPAYAEALRLQPSLIDASYKQGLVFLGMGRFQDAIACFDRVIGLNPAHMVAYSNRGIAQFQLERLEDALASYNKALALKPDFADAFYNRGLVLQRLKRWEEALGSYDSAIALDPSPDSFNNRGTVLLVLKQTEAALASFDSALVLQPNNAESALLRGNALMAERRFEEARDSFVLAVKSDPDCPFARGQLLHARMNLCDWTDFEKETAEIERGLLAHKRVSRPFAYQAIAQSPASARLCSEIFASHLFPARAPVWRGQPYGHRKIRIGYVSGEFRDQATSFLAAGLWEAHDKNRFEIHAFDNCGSDNGATRARIEAAFDSITDIRELTDRQAAEAIAAREIDILVNLNGYFGLERNGIFSRRPAPVQVNYLGFPATLGAPYIDYIIADRCVIPENERTHYAEKVVYLPDSYQVNDNKRAIGTATPTRADVGLPEKGFVFANFNNSYKLTPATFGLWMRILQQVEGSLLWLIEGEARAIANLQREAEKHGVAAGRLVFAPYIAPENHLVRHRFADLFLDGLPYNAHTTGSDALWAGLPLLTCKGTTFPGRVAATLLQAMRLPELITGSIGEYEALAVKLARNPELLVGIKAKLGHNRLRTPLFDTDRFRRHIEAAYTTMWERAERGQNPEGFAVAPINAG